MQVSSHNPTKSNREKISLPAYESGGQEFESCRARHLVESSAFEVRLAAFLATRAQARWSLHALSHCYTVGCQADSTFGSMTMESSLVEWPRRHYVPGGKHPFLFYVVYGRVDAKALSSTKYRSNIPSVARNFGMHCR
jgi:hypothetical protein